VDETRTAAQLLIVEDNALIALHLQSILTGLGYDVVGMVPSGERALQRVTERVPDVVLMDINLEGELDGIEAAALIQAQFDIPVIFLTGYSEDVLPQESELSGPHAYLSKPVHERELGDTIEAMLNRSGSSEK
jgi:CheY-like chemotaxis protein